MDDVDEKLLIGVDNLTRAISNQSNFGGYTEEKLLVAFKSFQEYFKFIEKENHVDRSRRWNIFELLNIPLLQFKGYALTVSNPNYHVERLAIALLTHGLNQQNSPKKYCELPEILNAEMSDYITFILKSKLEFQIPERMKDGDIEEIRELCRNTWNNENKLVNENFFRKVIKCFYKS